MTIIEYARSKTAAVRLAQDSVKVPDADPATGIIPIAKLTADLSTFVPKTVNMKNSDTIQLVRDSVKFGPEFDLGPINLTDPNITQFELKFPLAEFPADGTDTNVLLDYVVFDTDAENGEPTGFPITLRFDRLAPGGDELPPIAFTDAQLSGITVADISGGVLTLTIEPFYDSFENDQIELWLGTTATTGAYLTPTFPVTDPRTPHTVTITEAVLKAAPDGTKWFGYRVTDFAGNVSGLSALLPIPVFLSLPVLPAPLILENNDGLITYTDAVDEVGVTIPTFTGAAVGDFIYVVWGGETIAPFPMPNPIPTPPADIAEIAVPYDVIARVGSGTPINVSYWLQRTGTPRIDSPPAPVNVNLTTPGGPNPDPDPTTPEHDNINAPAIQCGTSPINSIVPADFGKDATATISRVGVDLNPIWLVNDVIQLHWGNVSAPGIAPVKVVAGNQGANISVPVPFTNVIEAEGVGDITVFFTITRTLDATNSVTVQSKPQTVNVISNAALPGDGTVAAGDFWEKNASNIITRAVGIRGTSFRITLSGVSNIDLAQNPMVSYDFVGVASGDAGAPGTAPPIETSRIQSDFIAITQADLTLGYIQIPLPYAKTYFICRNGATLDYKLKNDLGTVTAPRQFVRFAMNQGGGVCSVP